MKLSGLKGVALAFAGGIALSACLYEPLSTASDDEYGSYGYGYSYDDWGSWGYPTYGWYDGYYYPGTGDYVYDRYGTRQRWREADRYHWGAMRSRWRSASPAD